MHLLQLASIALVAIFSALTLLNLLTVRTVRNDESCQIDSSVDLLIPVRNEARNLQEMLPSVLNQKGLSHLAIHILDDHSSDSSPEILSKVDADNFSWRTGDILPDGWLGKNFACHQLASQSTADYLVFMDADVRLKPFAIASSIKLMREHQWSYLSPYPRQIARSWLEKLTQPLLQWSWFVSVPLRLAERLKIRSMVVANGQFLIVRRDSYFASGGHAGIRSEVLDDLELARALVSHGFGGAVADGSPISHCRMYETPRALIEGYTKSQWRAFGNIVGAILMSAILILSSIFPFVAALFGQAWGLIAFFAIVVTRVLVALKTRSVIATSFLHPISALIWIALIKLSWFYKVTGRLSWRGRAL